ncbi:hypothetical protein F2Q69_00031778, partial [Brassica cretica]
MVCDSQLWPPVATYNWVQKLAITLLAIAVDTLFLDPWTCTSDQESSLEKRSSTFYKPKELIRGKSQPLALSEYVSDLSRFGRVVQLTAFHPSESALNQINAVYLKQACSVLVLLETKFTLLTACSVLLALFWSKIGSCIFEATKIPCQSNKFVHELLSGVRQHFDRFIKDLKVIEDKSKLSEEHIPMLTDILGDEDKAKEVVEAGKASMEKALFRALKTRGNTPKYGLIFHSSNKCSVASRIDCFADSSTTAFVEKLREQVEERLEFYDKGVAPRKNVDVMKEVLESLEKKDEREAIAVEASEKNKKKDKRKTEEKDGEKSTKKKKSKTVEEELTTDNGHRRKRRRKLSHKVKNIPRQ